MMLSNWIKPFAPADGPPPKTMIAFFHWGLRGGYPAITLAACVSVISGLIEVASALMLGMVIDAALNGSTEGFFAQNTGLILLVSGFFVLFRPMWLWLSGIMQSVVIGPAISTLILSRLHRHTLGQSVTFFDDDFAGRISQKQMQAASALTNLVVDFIHTVVFAFASVVGSLVLVLTLDWRAGAALALWFAGYVAFLRFFMPRIRAASRERAGAAATVSGQIVDTIGNIKTVKLFAHDKHEDQAAINALEDARLAGVKWGWVSASFRGSLMVVSGVLPLLLVGITLIAWQNGVTTAGDIAVAGTIGLRLAQMTGWVSFTLMGMYGNVGVLEDAIGTLSGDQTLVDAQDAAILDVHAGAITLEDVTFAYDGSRNGIHNLSLTLNSGERIGIVGGSGAGKSTLVALLLRLYDVNSGRILIDDQDISTVTQESLRRQISMVTQETAMFNRSAFENIGYGSPDASQDEVIAAAKQAEAHEFIAELNDFKDRSGYDAHLGERGVKLSGGQRQRIAIARAILKDAPILVLDEATSALDSEVEAAIQSALDTVMEGKTVIAIAHRLSTLARMDRIIVLDAGRIKEQGTHADLLKQDGLYARYWNRQSGGFINVDDAVD